MTEQAIFVLLLGGVLAWGVLAPRKPRTVLRRLNRPLVRLLIRRINRDLARLEAMR